MRHHQADSVSEIAAMGEVEGQKPTPPLVPIATVRQMGLLLGLVGAFEAFVTWLGDVQFFGLVPAWLLGGILGTCGLSIALSPHRWQEWISRRLRAVADGNWSGKR
jgi:hypothetical protein